MSKRLARAFDFTADELTENQQGQLSDKQRKSLRKRMIFMSFGFGLIFLKGSILSIGVIRNAVDLFAFILAAPVVLLTLISFYGLWTTIRDTRSDLRQGIAASVTGVAEPYIRKGYRGPYMYLKIGTLNFMLDSPAFHADTRYQIFYAPATKVILSAVRLDD
jgi:hypothetical protein